MQKISCYGIYRFQYAAGWAFALLFEVRTIAEATRFGNLHSQRGLKNNFRQGLQNLALSRYDIPLHILESSFELIHYKWVFIL